MSLDLTQPSSLILPHGSGSSLVLKATKASNNKTSQKLLLVGLNSNRVAKQLNKNLQRPLKVLKVQKVLKLLKVLEEDYFKRKEKKSNNGLLIPQLSPVLIKEMILAAAKVQIDMPAMR